MQNNVFERNYNSLQFMDNKEVQAIQKRIAKVKQRNRFKKFKTPFRINNKPVYKVGKQVFIGNEKLSYYVQNTLKQKVVS